MIVLSAISAKTKNRRIVIQLLKSEEQPEEPPFVVVQTKRLIDAKSRHIVESESVYISELLIYFREIPEVAKALIKITTGVDVDIKTLTVATQFGKTKLGKEKLKSSKSPKTKNNK